MAIPKAPKNTVSSLRSTIGVSRESLASAEYIAEGHGMQRPPVTKEEMAVLFQDFANNVFIPCLGQLHVDLRQDLAKEVRNVHQTTRLAAHHDKGKFKGGPTNSLTQHVSDWMAHTHGAGLRALMPKLPARGGKPNGERGMASESDGRATSPRSFSMASAEDPCDNAEAMSLACSDETTPLVPGERPPGCENEFADPYVVRSESMPHNPCTFHIMDHLPTNMGAHSDDDDAHHDAESLSGLRGIVMGPTFDMLISAVVMCNAFVIGWETDWSARNLGQPELLYFKLLDLFFFAVFACELAMRLFVLRWSFFTASDWAWNWFDSFLVLSQAFDLASSTLCFLTVTHNLSFLRTMRTLRLIRIVRVGRLLHLISELRAMVASILGSFSSLCWALLLFVMMIYTVGVFFTQMVTERREDMWREDATTSTPLDHYYGNLFRTVLGLWACISGGTDWAEMLDPLVDEVSVVALVVFVLYTAFCILAMMNVVTGIFVEKSQANAEKDEAQCVIRNALETFEKADLNDDGEITWDAFQKGLANKEVRELFQAVSIDTADAGGLFRLLDTNENGCIGLDEFLEGWVKLRGQAKAVDLIMLMRDQERASKFMHQQFLSLESSIATILQLSATIADTQRDSLLALQKACSQRPASDTGQGGFLAAPQFLPLTATDGDSFIGTQMRSSASQAVLQKQAKDQANAAKWEDTVGSRPLRRTVMLPRKKR